VSGVVGARVALTQLDKQLESLRGPTAFLPMQIDHN
jgi:hypothetical protein